MNREQPLEILRRHQPALVAKGIAHAAIFGSVAQSSNNAARDLEIMIDTNPEKRLTIFDYVGLKEYIAGLFEVPVDVVRREGLKPHLRGATAEAIYAF